MSQPSATNDGSTSKPQDSRISVKLADMPEERQQQVISACSEAIDMYTDESEIAQFLKNAVELLDSPTWHCIVGASFGSCVAHTQDHFIYLELDFPQLDAFKQSAGRKCYVLLFKTV